MLLQSSGVFLKESMRHLISENIALATIAMAHQKTWAHPPCTQTLACRRFSMGRLVADGATIEENIWINASELSIAGRPLTNERVVLPRQRDLVLPESTDASADLRTAERQRPSPEQLRARKSRKRLQTMLASLMNVSEYQFGSRPVCVVNFTPYVEDLGLCVACPDWVKAR